VLEDGSLSYKTEGTPQGGVISPLLANIFLPTCWTSGWQRSWRHA
jgi:retron-type reverse transcriptase